MRRASTAASSCSPREGRHDLQRDQAGGRVRDRAGAARRRPRLLRADLVRARAGRARPADDPGAVQHLAQHPPGHAPRHALADRAARGGQAGALHQRVDLGRDRRPAPGLADLPGARRRRADRRAPQHAVRAGGLRARLPYPGAHHRGLLPDVGVLRAGGGRRGPLRRPRVRHRRAGGGGGDRRARRRLPGLHRAVDVTELAGSADREQVGRSAYELVAELFPICRSITGDGVRRTLDVLGKRLPLQRHEVPTGTPVFDWTVPREWNVTDAWVADASGRRVIDFQRSSLHVVSYSAPIRARMTLEELRPHLHTLPDHPDWIPYRTSYYQESWGFCLSQRQLEALSEGEYDVCIDSSLEPGHLTYGELLLPGQTEDEVLLSTHVCHPSLANDNLSGIAVSVALARHLAARPRRYSYRFIYAPGTIGAIAWLARNRATVGRVRHGLTLVCLGDSSPFTYQRTLEGTTPIDRAVAVAL